MNGEQLRVEVMAANVGLSIQQLICKKQITVLADAISRMGVLLSTLTKQVVDDENIRASQQQFVRSVLPRLLLQVAAPCPLFVTPSPFEKTKMTPCPFD